MKHTAEIDEDRKSWIIRDDSGKQVTETHIPLSENVSPILALLDAGKHICNILFPGIFTEKE